MNLFGIIKLPPLFTLVQATENLGVGTRNLGFVRNQSIPVDSTYLGPQWNIKRSFGPVNNPGYMKLAQELVPVGIRGSGLGISGQYTLSQLVDFTPPGN